MIRLPDFVVDIIDPAGRYLRDGRPRPGRRDLPRQFAEYTPVTGKPRGIRKVAPGHPGDARLVRFWHGDAVLEVGTGKRARIPRRALRDPDSLRAELARHIRTMTD
jgi:hypothetical protein